MLDAIMPDPCGADEIAIFSERGQGELGLLEWDKTATVGNQFANAVEKQGRALHQAATQDNHVRCKQIDEVGQTNPQVAGLPVNRLVSQSIALPRELADALGGEMVALRIIGRRIRIQPCHHRWSRSQRFPAAPEPARTERSSGIDDLVAKFGMSSIHTAIKVPVEDNPAANPGSNRDIDESRLVLSGTPTCLGESGGIGVRFHGYRHMAYARQVFHRILPAPSGQKINFAKLSGEWVYRTRGPNPYAH